MPLVTVYILCYNQAPYLNQRIDTVLQQTFTDYEVVIIDDASTDNSRDIIEQYRHHEKVTTILYNNKNSGSGYLQWQRAIETCKTKYLWIAEGDDFAEPDFLKETVNFLEQHQNIAIVETDSLYIKNAFPDIKFSDYKNSVFSKQLWKKNFTTDGKEFITDVLCYGNYITNVSAVLFRTSALKNLDSNFKNYKYSGDWALYMKFLESENFGYIHKVLSNFRLHDKNSTKLGRISGIALKENFVIIDNAILYLKKSGKFNKKYISMVNRYITIFGVPLTIKFKLLFFYFKTNPSLAIKGLYYNFKQRMKHTIANNNE